MPQLSKGSRVPFPEQPDEGYEIRDNMMTANISAGKIETVTTHFDNIRELRKINGYSFSDFAVLYRSGFLSRVIEH